MSCISNTRHSSLHVFACAARAVVGIGRSLLLLTTILLVTSPLTQRIWSWDHFLHGGQDYESNTLMLLVVFCLVLVLAQHCKQGVNLVLAARRLFSFISHDQLLAIITPVGVISASWTEHLAGPGLETYSLPLQI